MICKTPGGNTENYEMSGELKRLSISILAGSTLRLEPISFERMNTKTFDQKEKRWAAYSRKRLDCSEVVGDVGVLSVEQVENIAKILPMKAQDRASLLRQLCNTFGASTQTVAVFVRTGSALSTLMTIMTGSDTALQHEALACLINMATSTGTEADVMMKTAAPYLITFLSSSNSGLQSQSAWAMGNLVASSDSASSHMVALGVQSPLIQLLKSPDHDVVQSASFALANLSGFTKHTLCLLQAGLLPALEPHLVAKKDSFDTIAEVARIMFYVASSPDNLSHITGCQVAEKLTECFVAIVASHIHLYQVLTPLVRSLAAMSSDLQLTLRMNNSPSLMPAVGHVISSAPEVHLRKEALWLLTNLAAWRPVCESIISTVLSSVVASLASTQEVRIQACQCLCNIASHCPEYCESVLDNRGLESVVPLLSHPDSRVISAALYLCEILLVSPRSQPLFHSCSGPRALKVLTETPHLNEQVRAMARDLLHAGSL